MIRTVTLYPLPVANYNAANGCQNIALQFNDNSSLTTGTIASWAWAFGDGTTSVASNPSHQYLTVGTYSTNLFITSSNGCSAATSKLVTVYPVPTVSFTST